MNAITKSPDKALFILIASTVVVLAFWVVANIVPVYDSAIAGAIFEILWLPMVLFTLAVPIFALVKWGMNHFNIKSWYLLIAVLSISLITISFLVS